MKQNPMIQWVGVREYVQKISPYFIGKSMVSTIDFPLNNPLTQDISMVHGFIPPFVDDFPWVFLINP